MFRRLRLSLVVLLLSVSQQALAAPATPAEAKRLTGVFETYLGSVPGVVSVTPATDSYKVRIDFAPLIAKVPGGDFSASVTPIEMNIADRGDGTWQVAQDQSIGFTMKVPGAVEISGKIGSLRGSGVYDPAIAAFLTSTAEIADFSFDETVSAATDTPQRVAYLIKSMRYFTTSKAAANGGVDTMGKAEIVGLSETFGLPLEPAGPAMDITITVAQGSQDVAIKGLRSRAVLDLVAWLVAHPSPEAIVAAQDQLKASLRTSLPLWDNIVTTADLAAIAAMTPLGPVGIDKASIGVKMNGAVADGYLEERIAVEGLTLPPGLVPPWAGDLVPKSLRIGFSVADFNLAAPAERILNALDLAKEPPLPDMENQLLADLLPKGAVTISLLPSLLAGKQFEASAEGSMTAGPATAPAGQALVKFRGIDQIMQVLQAAPAEMNMQEVIAGLVAAKGMSKPEPDGGVSWKIEGSADGRVLINGFDPTKMGG